MEEKLCKIHNHDLKRLHHFKGEQIFTTNTHKGMNSTANKTLLTMTQNGSYSSRKGFFNCNSYNDNMGFKNNVTFVAFCIHCGGFCFLYINSMVPKDVEANHIYCNALYTCIQTGLERQKRLCAGLNPYVCHSTFYP